MMAEPGGDAPAPAEAETKANGDAPPGEPAPEAPPPPMEGEAEPSSASEEAGGGAAEAEERAPAAPAGNPLMSYFDTADDEDEEGGPSASPSGGAEAAATKEPSQMEVTDTTEEMAMDGDDKEEGSSQPPPPVSDSADEAKKETMTPPSGEGEAMDSEPENEATEPAEGSNNDTAGDADDEEGHKTPPPPTDGPPTDSGNDDPKSPDGSHQLLDATDTMEVDVSPTSLLEAERQAAIAAAIAANASSSVSPSVAAGIARVLALPGLVGERVNATVGEMSEKMASPSAPPGSGGGGMRQHPPPPPPRSYAAGPTMVALPPAPPLPPKRTGGQMMRPVRFDDVQAAFGEILRKKAEKRRAKDRGDGDKDKEKEAGETTEGGTEGIEAAVPEFKRMSTEDLEHAEEGLSDMQVEDDGPEKSGPKAKGEGGAMEVDANGDVGENDGEEAMDSEDEIPSKTPGDSEDEIPSKKPGDVDGTKSDAPEKGEHATIPDSFLRFLLLVARVPIIIEEHKKPSSPTSSSKSAAVAAATRAYDILKMARRAYEDISQQQRRSLQDTGYDATTSFYAACAGERAESPAGGDSSSEWGNGQSNEKPPSTPPLMAAASTTATAPLTATASSMASSASAVFSNVLSKMGSTKKQGSFADIGKKFMSGGTQGGLQQTDKPSEQPAASPASSPRLPPPPMHDYEVMLDQEMLGLTVENVLERTVIRTLLKDGAAEKAGARVGSLIAKVGNVDTSNLTHFETIDELRQSQKPLRLTLRHIGGDVLRRAREEMGRLIKGRGVGAVKDGKRSGEKPWRDHSSKRRRSGETFDSVLSSRWPSMMNKASSVVSASGSPGQTAPPAMTRAEMMHKAGADLIRILALLVVGLEKEMAEIDSDVDGEASTMSDSSSHVGLNKPQHLSAKELSESIEISSKILLDFARSHPDVDEKQPGSMSGGGSGPGSKPQHQGPGSSFYPVPPGRVQGKKHGGPPPPPAGRGAGRGRGGQSKSKKKQNNSPLLRIGDALSRTRSFMVETSSSTAAALRWEIIDHLCAVLDLDTEQELSEKESASSSAGGAEASGPTNDLGSAGSILKLIVLNCSTLEGSLTSDGDLSEEDEVKNTTQEDKDSEELDSSSLDQSLDQSIMSVVNTSNAGNPFLSVVHRLAASKSTSARVTACSLGPVLWSHLDFPRQLQLRGVITRALHDVEVIVRKTTAAVLHEIAELVFDRRAVPWLVLMCERSMTDPEPQLRAAAMTLTWHLAEHLPNAFLGDASMGSRSIRRLPPRDSATFMDVYLLQCKLLPVANNLAEDQVASVRLSVAAQCDRLCNALGEHWHSVIIDLLQALLSDSDERVRSEAILTVPRLCESVITGSSSKNNITVLESLLPLALRIQKDPSPLVRSSLATATGELLIFLVGLGGGSDGESDVPSSPGRGSGASLSFEVHKKHVDDTLIPILQKLLQDSDPEVTTASLRAVTNASRSGTRETASTHIPTCHHIDDDSVSLSSHHSHQSHISHERAKPVFIPVLSEEQVLRLLPTLSNLATSAQWRVRQSAVEIVPALMGCTSRQETRHEVSKLCLKLMNDRVDAVRKTAAECLCLGGSSLARHGVDDGGQWINQIVVPHLKSCSQSDNSKQRLLSLKMVEVIVANDLAGRGVVERAKTASTSESPGDDESVSSSSVAETPLRTILNIAASCASDNVANVRLNVGRTFCSVIPLLDKSDVEFAVSALEKQLEEETSRPSPDRDVTYYAQQAISLAQPFRRVSSTMSG